MKKKALSLCLCMILALSCAGCRGRAVAASMWLVKTEGQVEVSDEKGSDVELSERLGLFSGYQVDTRKASYGWIDLDEVKLTKLDEDSEMEVRKDGKKLEVVVTKGSLYFDITKPLEEDEELTIRSSNMVTAIRGTSGWVTLENEDSMSVWILDGTVECSICDDRGNPLASQSVTAWERAKMDTSADEIAKEAFTEDDIPGFIRVEKGLPGLNAYGAVIFELRENYLDYSAMPADFQTAVQHVVEGLENRDRDLLMATVTMDAFSPYTKVLEGYGGMQILEFFTKYDGRKVSVRVESEPGEAVFFELAVRPENGPGLSCRAEIDFDPDGAVNFWRYTWADCPCADWQMEGQAALLVEENASGGDDAELSDRQTGMIVHNLRDGHWGGMEHFGVGDADYDQGRRLRDVSVPNDVVFNVLDTGKREDDLDIYW